MNALAIRVTLMPHAPILLVATSVNVTLGSLGVDLIAPVWIQYFLFSPESPFVYPDINECDEDTDTCDGNATCSDTEGGYDCECNVGYSGDGYSCSS